MTFSDRIKYIADLLLTLSNASPSSDNYRQLPLPIAILVCLIGFVFIGLLIAAGVLILLNYLK